MATKICTSPSKDQCTSIYMSNQAYLEPAKTNVLGNPIELPFKVGTVYFEVQKIREETVRVLLRSDLLG